jgi:probable rRNA maturation factor
MTAAVFSTNTTSIPLGFRPKIYAKNVLTFLDVKTGTFSFTFVSQKKLADLHAVYLNDPSETDIMTFNLGEPDTIDGDMYISVDQAAIQAKEQGHSLTDELKILVIHGILHLLGYDDLTSSDKKVMFKEQDRVFKALA